MSLVAFLGPQNASKSLAAGASPQILLEAYSTSPNSLVRFNKPTLRSLLLRGEDRRGGERGAKIIYALGRR